MKYQGVDYGQVIDLARYPIDSEGSDGYLSLVQELKLALDGEQICQLPGFLRERCRREEVERVTGLQYLAHAAHSRRNVYLERTTSPDLPADHPKNIMNMASYRMIGAHLLPDESALKQLYYWPAFQRFVAEVTGSGVLYPSADPYQPVNVICYADGDQSAWHFDSDNAFTMTLMLQASEQGGGFQINPDCRSDSDPNTEQLSQFLLGDHRNVRTLEREEGALVIFRGCHSAHRVTPVSGTRPRLMGVMVYEKEPGVIGDPVVNETVYGIPQSTEHA